jgi:hypothetical protein
MKGFVLSMVFLASVIFLSFFLLGTDELCLKMSSGWQLLAAQLA